MRPTPRRAAPLASSLALIDSGVIQDFQLAAAFAKSALRTLKGTFEHRVADVSID